MKKSLAALSFLVMAYSCKKESSLPPLGTFTASIDGTQISLTNAKATRYINGIYYEIYINGVIYTLDSSWQLDVDVTSENPISPKTYGKDTTIRGEYVTFYYQLFSTDNGVHQKAFYQALTHSYEDHPIINVISLTDTSIAGSFSGKVHLITTGTTYPTEHTIANGLFNVRIQQ